jgi:para-aminobenzoate synthetase component I
MILSPDAAMALMNRKGLLGVPFLFILDFELEKTQVLNINEASGEGIYFSLPGITNYHPNPGTNDPAYYFKKNPVDFATYLKAFEMVSQHIHYGDSYLLNLTFPSLVETNLGLEEIFSRSSAPFKLLIQDQCVVFSPERFIQIRGNTVSAFPMKGTIDASLPDAEKQILNDPKEMAEHATIVDLLRNDISYFSNDVTVVRYRYVDRVKTSENSLLQVSSEISGKIKPSFSRRIGDIIFSMLPAGSVSGAPKNKTVQIIREVEKSKRGYFTGVFGVFDGEQLDSGVMIRYIERNGAGLVYRSGGGITHMSEPEPEYNELIAKVYVQIH